MGIGSRIKRVLADAFVDEEVAACAARLDTDLGELGVDSFGYDPEVLKSAVVPVAWLYRHYFRVIVKGIERVPRGRVMLVANHSGQLPFDGLMIGTAMLLDGRPPRAVRAMVEKWVPRLPFISVFFARVGQIVGTPDNCKRLLEKEEAILVFPEGVRGISKTIGKRYQLQRFGTGFMRLALANKTPIVPVGVVGAEEQAPSFFNLKALAKLVGAPAFPVTPTFPLLGPLGLLPFPSRYRIEFGEPMMFEGDGDEEDVVVQEYIESVRNALADVIHKNLAERKSVFW